MMKELQAALRQAPLDQEEINRLAMKYGELQAQDIQSRISSVMVVRKTLTPEQVQILEQQPPSDKE